MSAPVRELVRDNGRSCGLAVIMLMLLTVTVHLLPLSISSFPLNNDSLTECRIAEDIVSSGQLSYSDGSIYFDTPNLVTPVFNVLIAFFAAFLGFSTFDASHVVVVFSSLTTVLFGYRLAKEISGSEKGAILSGLFLSMFGTLVFLTISAWKESLGFALFVLLFYAYVHRSNRGMFMLEVAILAVLPFVHHLVTGIAYLSIALLTTWSAFSAVNGRKFGRRQIVDTVIIVVCCAFAFFYYSAGSVDKLSYITTIRGLLSIILLYAGMSAIVILLLVERAHVKWTLAPFAGIAILVFLGWDYINPMFDYIQGTPETVLLLIASYCVLMTVAWYGFEEILVARSKYRAVPYGLFLPVVVVVLFALVMGDNLAGHQVVYRSFDFADLSIAIGVAIAIGSLHKRPRTEFFAVIAVLCALLVSFPFGFATGVLTGVRHDTQEYEVDALRYASEAAGEGMTFQSDERLSYIAMALFDFRKLPTLPDKLNNSIMLNLDVLYCLEEEWTTVGVNDYPRGHPIIDEGHVATVLQWSQVLYVGGPSDNNIVVFSLSPAGIDLLY